MSPFASAERKTTVNTQLDFSSGASNFFGGQGFSQSPLQRGLRPFYSGQPTLLLESKGPHSELKASYGFQYQRYQNGDNLDVYSHMANLGLTSDLSKGVRLRLDGSFYNAPDYQTIQVFRGIIPVEGGFTYVFDPLLERRPTMNGRMSAGLETDLGPKSTLTFGGNSSYRHTEGTAVKTAWLQDQLRVEANAGFTRKINPHHSWSLRYTVAENRYQSRGRSRTHSALFGYSGEPSPTWRLTFDAGPSYTESPLLPKAYAGYAASAGVTKVLRANQLSIRYAHRSGDGSGLGTVTDTDNGGLAFSRAFGRRVTLTTDLSAFQSKYRAEDLSKMRGYYGSLALSFTLSRHWFLNFGGSYRKNEQSALLDMASERIYASIRYDSSAPRGGK